MKDTHRSHSVPIHLAVGWMWTSQIEAAHRIAYKEKHKVYVAALGKGSPRLLFHDRQRSLSCPLAWSADGKILYHSQKQIYAILASLPVSEGRVADWRCN